MNMFGPTVSKDRILSGASYILRGSKVALVAPSPEHAGPLTRFLNDLNVLPGAGSLQIHTVESALQGPNPWLAEAIEGRINDFVRFVVVECDSDRTVGTTELFDINHRLRTAEFGIFMGHRGSGYGTEASLLTLDWAFHVLGMRNVMLRVSAWNEEAIHVYEKCGFKEIGRRRLAHNFAGVFFDEVYMDILAQEFGHESRVVGGLPDSLKRSLSEQA